MPLKGHNAEDHQRRAISSSKRGVCVCVCFLDRGRKILLLCCDERLARPTDLNNRLNRYQENTVKLTIESEGTDCLKVGLGQESLNSDLFGGPLENVINLICLSRINLLPTMIQIGTKKKKSY